MLVFMFPGQSSCSETMLSRALSLGPSSSEVLACASEVLGEDLGARFADGVRPACNRDVQLSVFIVNHMHMVALHHAGLRASLSLGLSLGEYNHLVHIGAIAFEDALRVVATRGEIYDRGPRGMMVAVAGVESSEIEAVLAGRPEVWISNYNAPTQCVIAGGAQAVRSAAKVLEDEHYAMTFVIERAVPMHCKRFEPAGVALRPALQAAGWVQPVRGYFPNVRGRPSPQSTADSVVESLCAHVSGPVQWSRSMDWIAEHHRGAMLIEVGPGRVLYDLTRRGWPVLSRARTDDGTQPGRHLETLTRRLWDDS